MRKRDTWLLLLSIIIVFISLYRQKDYKLNLLFQIPIDTNNYENSHYPKINEYLPLPIITDLDGDGTNEIIYITNDFKLRILQTVTIENIESFRIKLATTKSTTTANNNNNGDENNIESSLIELPILYEVSLLSDVGLSAGRKPVAIKTGYTQQFLSSEQKQQVIVVVTDGWAVLCFNNKLKKQWESYASDEVLSGHYQSEISITILPTTIPDDKGIVIVGGRMEPLPDYIHRAHNNIPPMFGNKGDTTDKDHDHDRDDHDQEGFESHREENHFSYFSYDAQNGYKRWSHEENDFKPENTHMTEEHRKDSDISLHSFKQHIFSQLEHLGEVDWRVYRDSILASLPHKWSSNFDTKLEPRHFEKKINTIRGGTNNDQSTTSNTLNNEMLSVYSSNFDTFSILSKKDQATFNQVHLENPNVIVTHHKYGIEVIHIASGKTLCKLVLEGTDFYSDSNKFIVYLDLNDDGVLDQVRAYAGNFKAHLKPNENKERSHCIGMGLSGLPPKEDLFSLKICNDQVFDMEYYMWKDSNVNNGQGDFNTGDGETTPGVIGGVGMSGIGNIKQKQTMSKSDKLIQTLPPTFFRSTNDGKLSILFLVNTGLLSCFSAKGKKNWKVETNIHWSKHLEPNTFPSLTVFSFDKSMNSQMMILGIGESNLVVLNENGQLLVEKSIVGATQLNPIMAPPIIADFNNDGINDILITTLDNYSIYVTEKGTYSTLLPMIGLILIGALLFLLLLSGDTSKNVISKKLFSTSSSNTIKNQKYI